MKLNLQGYIDGHAYKIMRIFVVAMVFLSIVTLQGVSDQRQAHQMIFMLACISLFSLILRNIWVTLFVLWTVFLYSFFKFTTGSVYLTTIFLGASYYFITKISFDKKHINLFINSILWFLVANLFYMAIQLLGYDFIYGKWQYIQITGVDPYLISNKTPYGFMNHLSILGTFIALCIPLLATRGSKTSLLGSFLLFIPLIVIKTSLCFISGGLGLLFVLYFKLKKWFFGVLVVLLLVCSLFYISKVDRPGTERLTQWKYVLNDAIVHPITGWGLDSFANVTPQKDFRYAQTITQFKLKGKDRTSILWWDNPHNLYISLFYEFGLFGLLFFICYVYFLFDKFGKSIRNLNTIGLAGFILGFLVFSIGHFPIFLARTAVVIIPAFALMEVAIE